MILQLKNISEISIFKIMSNTLSSIDPKLSAHGDRVAFIVMKMLEKKGMQPSKQLAEATLVAMLHDIGVYRKDEVTSISKFDHDKSWEHSIKGYITLESVSPLSTQADAVLYHHLDYNKFDRVESPNRRLAQVIRVADRFDISGYNIQLIKSYSGTRFNPECVGILEQVDSEVGFRKQFYSDNYRDELQSLYNHIEITSGTLKEWLRTIVYPLNFQARNDRTLHSSYVAILAANIAKGMGMTDQEVSDQYIMGALQDIGIAHTKSKDTAILRTAEILRHNIPERMHRPIYQHCENLIGTGEIGSELRDLDKASLVLIATNYIAHEVQILQKPGLLTEQELVYVLNKPRAKCHITEEIRYVLERDLGYITSEINVVGEDVDVIYNTAVNETKELLEKLSKIE